MQTADIGRHRSTCSVGNAWISSDAIHLQMVMMNVARQMTQISRQVWLRFGMLRRPFEAPRTKAMLSRRKSNRFPRLSVDRQAWRNPMTLALPSPRIISKDFLQTPPNSTQQGDMGCRMMDGTFFRRQRDHQALTENSPARSQQGTRFPLIFD